MNDITETDFIITVIKKQTGKVVTAVRRKKRAGIAVSRGEITVKEYLLTLGKYDVEKQELLRLVKLL